MFYINQFKEHLLLKVSETPSYAKNNCWLRLRNGYLDLKSPVGHRPKRTLQNSVYTETISHREILHDC